MIYEVLDNLPELLTQNAEAFGQTLAGINLNVQVGVADQAPVMGKISFDPDGTPVVIGFENSIENGNVQAVLYLTQGEQDAAVRFEFGESADETTFKAEISVSGYVIGQVDAHISKTQTTRFGAPVFTVNASMAGAALEIKAENQGEKDVFSIDLSGLDNLTGDTQMTGYHVDFTATDEDKTEAIEKESIDISNYTLDELGSLIQQIGQNLSNYYNGI